jgi:tRNA threonylcarbamoyladenosine biosynthesis protein TsaB
VSGPLLAVDSSTAYGSAAVGDVSGIFAETVLRVAGGHSSALLPAVDGVMRTAGLRPRDLAGIVVAGGPGSFTGLRIAAATGKGMVAALNVPLYAFSGLLATAAAGWGTGGPVCALFDARRRDVYAAVYRFAGSAGGVANHPPRVLVEPSAWSLDDLLEKLRPDPPLLFVGEAALIHEEEIRSTLGSRVAPAHLALPRASALVWLAARFPDMGLVPDRSGWEPDYLRASGAERIAADRLQEGRG